MDFVVVGLGLGALAILAGVILLGWVTGRWQRAAASAATLDDARYARAIAVSRQSAGQALLFAGGAILLATIGALAGALDDQTGAFLVTTTTTVAAVGFLIWEHLARLRNPIPAKARPHAPAAPRRAAANPERSLPFAMAADELVPDVAELTSPLAAVHWDGATGNASDTDELSEEPAAAHSNGVVDEQEAAGTAALYLGDVQDERGLKTPDQETLSADEAAPLENAGQNGQAEPGNDRTLTLIPLADYRDAKAARVQSAQRSQADGGGSGDE